MSDPIRPALTPEEWARVHAGNDTDVIAGEYVSCTPEDLTADGSFDGRERHALAALALHNQTFGFTREHAEAIRRVVRLAVYAKWAPDGELSTHDAELCERAAALIDALLPPKE